ncbi:hypothetical protein TNCV_1128551 [Trichonephila clavipes]|nr:hypothetical protein TNCV_1128551 [Trichonephila clavipes]
MEIPLRTAYGQNGRCDMQPKATQSSRAGALNRNCNKNFWTLEQRIREKQRGRTEKERERSKVLRKSNNSRAIGDGSRNFEAWFSDKDDITTDLTP